MTASEFLARLQRVKQQQGDMGWLASCPAHGGSDGDRNPSLSIRAVDDKILLKCFAGCDSDRVLAAMGLTSSDLFVKESAAPKRELHATYDYKDENGVLLYQACRYTPKGFSQRRPDGKGGWIYNLQETRRVLYRLPELKTHKAILFVEGEKDADKCWSIGVPATCNPMGAGKWDQAYAAQLSGAGVARVAIIPDNDEVGRQHAQNVGLSLQKAGLEVRVVPLPDVPEHGDVSDYLRTRTKAELLSLVKATPLLGHSPIVRPKKDKEFKPLGERRYRLSIESSGVVMEVDHLRRDREGMTGELLVKVNGHFPSAKTHRDGILTIGDFNFASVQARSTRAKLLAERAGDRDFDWYGLLEDFVVEVVAHERQGSSPVILGSDDLLETEEPAETWDVEGFPVLIDDAMVLFGDSASGKSYFALWLAGELANRGVKVLYIDWEFSEREHRKRLKRLFQPTPKNLHYIRSDMPLIREVARFSRLIADNGYNYVIADSIGFAVDGPAETHEAARGYFGALRYLGIGSLSLAHIAKARDDGKEATIYGSTFFRAGARSAWFIDRATENPRGELNIALQHRKSNQSDLKKPLAYRLKFNHERVFVERTDITKVDALVSHLPLIERLKRHMSDGELYAYKDLAEEMCVPIDTVRKTVARSKVFQKMLRKVRLNPAQPADADPEPKQQDIGAVEF